MKTKAQRVAKRWTVAVYLLCMAQGASATVNSASFHYVFRNNRGESLEYKVSAPSEKEALSQAASACLRQFYPKTQDAVSQDQKDDLIDLCANPKKI